MKLTGDNSRSDMTKPLPKIVLRFESNPLLDINVDQRLGTTVNGPSVITAPDWLPNRLARFYMYFADHVGQHIKLAYSDHPTGPWVLHEPGTLHLSQASAFRHHIASPDVHVDEENRQIRMYFHGPVLSEAGQRTGVATSSDGIDFQAHDRIQGLFYFRVWKHNDVFYALAKNGNTGYMAIYRSPTGLSDWEFGRNFLPHGRHAAVDVQGDHLDIYYSMVGGEPEHIVRSTVSMAETWENWRPSPPETVLMPETDYEGIAYPVRPSEHGMAVGVRQLRDPAIFNHEGRKYLFYSGAGEETINGAVFLEHDQSGCL